MKEGKYSPENGFKNAIRCGGVVLVDFNASWCAPCRAQEPIIRQLAIKFEAQARVTSLNIDENRETALKLCIHSIPTLVLFKNGKEIQRFIGLQSEKFLSQAIENVLR
jgi:thioredoxin 1